jgi:hypothetical protein
VGKMQEHAASGLMVIVKIQKDSNGVKKECCKKQFNKYIFKNFARFH